MRKSANLLNEEANERRNLLRIRCADLVRVTAFNQGAMTVDVKPLEKRVKISSGDIGVVVYLDQDSDNSLKTGAESMPNSTRIHSGDDAVFVGVIQKG